MAHLNILSAFFTTLSLLLLLLFPSSSLAYQALFSEPPQVLWGGQRLTDGELSLSLSNDCSLFLYDRSVQVVDFKTTVRDYSTQRCALLVSTEGQLRFVTDNELIPTTKVDNAAEPGRYALLFIDGKLGIFGPSVWDNGVNFTSTYSTTSHHLKSGQGDNLLISGYTISGNADFDVIAAQIHKSTAFITNSCTLSVKNSSNRTVWETEPKNSEPTACGLTLKHNGELLLQGRNENGVYTQWTNGYAGKEMPYVCLLRYNGQILVYGLKTWLYRRPSTVAASDAAIKMHAGY